jgi:hypothetical protein
MTARHPESAPAIGRKDLVTLLDLARGLLRRADPRTAGLWPRAAALLGRQALEAGLDAYWAGRGIALGDCATRSQLICLRSYLPDAPLAARVHHAWGALSDACHHHGYELAPTAGELGALLETVGELLEAVDDRRAGR